MSEITPLDWTIDTANLPEEGLQISFEASEADRARLAAIADVVSVGALTARGEVRPFGGGVEVRLRLKADVVQSCVVSLAPVADHIDELILRRYLADWQAEDLADPIIEIAPGDEDPPEALVDDKIDLGQVLTEQFILALNPYPRAPDAALPDKFAAGAGEVSPFAVLKRLKDPG